MKRYPRILSMILVLTLLLCGCGPKSDDNGTEGTTTAPTEQTTLPVGTTSAPTEPNDGKKDYTVTVVDQNGSPVANVSVQFCDENGSCQLPVRTNDQGVVTKSLVPMTYHVKLTLPEGYSCDTLEYTLTDATELTVTVNAG